MRDFNGIDPVAQPRNIVAWTPVVAEILQGCRDFEDESVSLNCIAYQPMARS
jgi:brefeldin A-inhibited guanine nucleotide-exchange protein